MAAREIKTLIAESAGQIEDGGRSVEEAGGSMADLVASVRQVGDLIGQISRSSTEQAEGLQEMRQAIVEMDQVTQQNLALVEQAASAACGLQQQALNLSQAVARFKLDDGAPSLPPGDAGAEAKKSPGAARLRLASNRA